MLPRDSNLSSLALQALKTEVNEKMMSHWKLKTMPVHRLSGMKVVLGRHPPQRALDSKTVKHLRGEETQVVCERFGVGPGVAYDKRL